MLVFTQKSIDKLQKDNEDFYIRNEVFNYLEVLKLQSGIGAVSLACVVEELEDILDSIKQII